MTSENSLPVVPARCGECAHSVVGYGTRYCTHGDRDVGITRVSRDETPPAKCPLRSAT